MFSKMKRPKACSHHFLTTEIHGVILKYFLSKKKKKKFDLKAFLTFVTLFSARRSDGSSKNKHDL